MKKLIVIIIIVILFSGAAFASYTYKSSTIQSIQKNVLQKTQEYKSIFNNKGSLKIPADWQTSKEQDSTSFYSPEVMQLAGEAIKGCKITTTREENAEKIAPGEYLKKLENNLKDDTFTVISQKGTITRIANKSALDWAVETGETGYTRSVFIFLESDIYIATLYTGRGSRQECDNTFNEMITTIQVE